MDAIDKKYDQWVEFVKETNELYTKLYNSLANELCNTPNKLPTLQRLTESQMWFKSCYGVCDLIENLKE